MGLRTERIDCKVIASLNIAAGLQAYEKVYSILNETCRNAPSLQQSHGFDWHTFLDFVSANGFNRSLDKVYQPSRRWLTWYASQV